MQCDEMSHLDDAIQCDIHGTSCSNDATRYDCSRMCNHADTIRYDVLDIAIYCDAQTYRQDFDMFANYITLASKCENLGRRQLLLNRSQGQSFGEACLSWLVVERCLVDSRGWACPHQPARSHHFPTWPIAVWHGRSLT